jgi:hypothetical protein
MTLLSLPATISVCALLAHERRYTIDQRPAPAQVIMTTIEFRMVVQAKLLGQSEQSRTDRKSITGHNHSATI